MRSSDEHRPLKTSRQYSIPYKKQNVSHAEKWLSDRSQKNQDNYTKTFDKGRDVAIIVTIDYIHESERPCTCIFVWIL